MAHLRWSRRASRAAGAALLALAALPLSAAPASRPGTGRHAADLCVQTSAAPRSCGPAQVDLKADGSARIRIDDIVYRLQLHSSQVDVVLMHGAVQIDEFSVPYEWVGRALRFNDPDRGVRYEVDFDASKRSR